MSPAIRTPDQRLRVFVSSTLRELAEERKAARTAIERLAAAPVMFELGARPHPPRQLYRAYLEQSDIFVGLYWEKYGWVAPGESVSGLEDEYNLAPPGMPRLVYIKETARGREPRLEELLARIRADDAASFKYFSTPAELGELLVTDLAVLLAERFDESRSAAPLPQAAPEQRAPVPSAALPTPLTRLFGREPDIERVAAMIRSPATRLLTLVGPGGIGKTRLSIAVARHVERDFPDGVAWVPLAPVTDAVQVPNAIAHALGVRDTGDVPVASKFVAALRDRRMLLVLDNFEHVLAAAPLLTELLAGAPGLKILVTSRALLRVTGEQSAEVSPLSLPGPRYRPWQPEEPLSAAVQLLVERARAVKPDFELTEENVDDVEAIAARLEGVPLAIELAAARLRLLSPADLLDRLGSRLTLLVGGHRNLPPRQQAVRSTIEWSTRLLGADEQDLLWRLGVFAGRFSLEAVESVAESPEDAIPLLEALVDSSLVRQVDRNDRTYFLLLATVREYALERLDDVGRVGEMRKRHAQYYGVWASQISPDVIGPKQRESVALLNNERDNLRAAELYLLGKHDWSGAMELAWSIWPYWWIGGMLGELRQWAETVLASGDPLSDRVRAIVLCIVHASFFWDRPDLAIIGGLEESASLFEKLEVPFDAGVPMMSLAVAYAIAGDLDRADASVERGLRNFRVSGNRWGESVLLVWAARLLLAKGDRDGAIDFFERGLAIGRELQNYLALSIALHYLGWARLIGGEVERATEHFEEALHISPVIQHDQGIAWDLESFLGIAAAIGDAERAGLLAGAAEALRERIGLPDKADAVFHGPVIAQLRSSALAPVFEDAFARGRRLPIPEAIAIAEEVARAVRPVEAGTR